MKWLYITLCFVVLVNCNGIERGVSNIITDERVNQWEIATYDTISNIFFRNLNNKVDSIEVHLLSSNSSRLYGHLARRHVIERLKTDKILLKSRINDLIIVECTRESHMEFIVIFNSDNKYRFLTYSYSFYDKGFVVVNNGIIDNRKIQRFIEKVKKSDLFKNESNNGESYNGEVVVSIFSKDKVEVFPYLTFNFSNEVFRSYNEMFK